MPNDPSAFTIGGNDEHGTEPPTPGKRTPVMPYINRSILENEFNRAAKLRFLEACLRVGFNVYDVKPETSDPTISARVARINSRRLTRLVTFGYNAYGSGGAFNEMSGFVTAFSSRNPYPDTSRAYAEDITLALERSGLKLNSLQDLDIGVLGSVNCVSALIEPGFMTEYSEAARMLDPDFAVTVAEAATRATWLSLDVRYVERDDMSAYTTVRPGERGNAVRLLQYLLISEGFDIAADGVFGGATRNALVDYQLLSGLDPDGVAGANTFASLLALNTPSPLKRGDGGASVTLLQRRLLSRLYPVGADGIFGSETESAVRDFQREHSLPVTGIADAATVSALLSSPPRPRLY